MKVRVISGGVSGGRPIDTTDLFEVALAAYFQGVDRDRRTFSEALWSSLTNIVWSHATIGARLYSYRAAGDLVAALHGDSDYLEWYCSSPSGAIDEDIDRVLCCLGWSHSPASALTANSFP
jgi:hypothetical protein